MIDTSRQLELLGYKAGDTVFLRFFYPSNDPRKSDDSGLNLEFTYPDIPWDKIKTIQSQGKGCYFVVNGQGNTDRDVKFGKAMFYEHDDLLIEDQINLWQSLGLPVPTFQVATGGKSIHSYWVFDNPVEISLWIKLQIDLLEFSKGDNKIKNPSRVMRFVGANHIDYDKGVNPTEIISESGVKYTYEYLRNIIPVSNKSTKNRTRTTKKRGRGFGSKVEVSNHIPLFNCLARVNRDYIEAGTEIGNRNNAALQIARDLIGTSRYLESIGQAYSGDARSLFDKYCDHCDPSAEAELDDIWEKTLSYDPDPSLDYDYIKNCIYTWYRMPASSSDPVVSAESLAQKINQYQKSSEILDDLEEYDPTNLRKEIESIKNAKDIWHDIKKSFPKDVIEVFEHFHKHLGTPRELYALTFLTTISGSLNGKYKVLVSSKTNWYEPLNIYTVVIGNKGVNKSAVVNLFCNYHDHKNEEYLLQYREAEKQYKIDFETWKRINKSGDAEAMGESQPEPPILRYSSIGQSTMAKLIQVMDTQRNNYKASLLVSVDELSTILDAVNKFDGGSDDIGRLLEMWNARRVTSSTKGEGTVGTFGMISIIATTQPATWVRMMAKHSAHGTNGFNDRFLVGELREEDQKLFDHNDTTLPPHDMSKIMERYSNLFDSLPANQTITINPGLGNLLNQIEKWFAEDRSGRAKSKSYIFRLAGVLACLRDAQNPIIQAQDINSAWRLAIYSEACIKSIGGEARETLGAELVSKAANIYDKRGECSYTTLKQGNASAFRGLSKVEMEAIILKVAETVTDGEIVTTRTGSKKLVRVESKVEVKTELETKVETEVDVTTELEPEVIEAMSECRAKYKNTLAALADSDIKLDESIEPTVECTHTENLDGLEFVNIPVEALGFKLRQFATSNNRYQLVDKTDDFYQILIPGKDKPVKINRSQLE